jgi:hypothetical protein
MFTKDMFHSQPGYTDIYYFRLRSAPRARGAAAGATPLRAAAPCRSAHLANGPWSGLHSSPLVRGAATVGGFAPARCPRLASPHPWSVGQGRHNGVKNNSQKCRNRKINSKTMYILSSLWYNKKIKKIKIVL